MTLSTGFDVTSKLIALAVLISSLEVLYLAGRGEFNQAGLWSWEVIHAANAERLRWTATIFRRRSSVVGLMLVRACSALAMGVFSFGTIPFVVFASIACLAQMLTNVRIVYGDDGSDQMTTIVLAAVCLAAVIGTEQSLLIAAWFLSIQLMLSYFCSGAAKLLGKKWRSGLALASVMNHYSYGNRWLSDALTSMPTVGRVLTYAVIAFQLTFPISFFIDIQLAAIFLAGGLVFHLGIAAVMRLNGFLLSFCAAYPVYVALIINGRGF